ncbi:hypothetical protein SMICM304S_02328 [Streptomyces microflavus]
MRPSRRSPCGPTLLEELPELRSLIAPRSPFRGLDTFQEADADVFFGGTPTTSGGW